MFEVSTSNRREFLYAGAASAFAFALGQKADAADENSDGEWRNRNPDMSYRRLGRTNYMISEMICGGNTISVDNFRHVEEAIERGLNYLDTAPAYGGGKSEPGFAKLVAGSKRDRVFLNTKVSGWRVNRDERLRKIFDSLSEPERKKLRAAAQDELERRRALDLDHICHYFGGQQKALESSILSNVVEREHGHLIDRPKHYGEFVTKTVESSLRSLGTDYLDLLMCPHGANSAYELTEFPEVLEAFARLKKAGKVRHLGVSGHSDPSAVIEGAIAAGEYSAAMVAYNIVNHSYVDAALDKARDADLGVIAMKVARPCHHGRGNGQPNDPRRVAMIHKAVPGDLKVPQKCYLWALRDSRIAAVNSELKNSEMVAENLPLAGRKVARA